MKFRVERDVLAEAVVWAARTLPTRSTVPMLAGILLDAEQDTLSVAGSDQETSVRAEVLAEVDEPGRVLVPGRLLADITRSLPPRPVLMTLEGTRLAVACGRSRFELPIWQVEDYPQLPSMPATSGTVPGSVLAAAVHQVAIAASRDETLPMLTGVRVEVDGDAMTLAATDRYRLAVRELPWQPEVPDLQTNIVVPARVFADTARSMAGVEDIRLAFPAGDALMGIAGQGRHTTTRLLHTDFPNYQKLLPSDSSISTVVTIETATLVEAVKRVSLVAEKHVPVRLAFTPGEVVLTVETGDEARGVETCECELEGEPLTIGFNPRYLLDGLAVLAPSSTRISFVAADRPAVLSSVADEELAYRYLLMPFRLPT